MTQSERIELALIAASALVVWQLRAYLPATFTLAESVLGLSALLLGQGLVRDVIILLRAPNRSADKPRQQAQCMCLESTVGATGVVAGIVLMLALTDLGMWNRNVFLLAALSTMLIGLLLKDVVVTWSPLGFKKERDHLNLIVRWRSRSV
jgi:hypothetical protein